jgi:hypothetical protein
VWELQLKERSQFLGLGAAVSECEALFATVQARDGRVRLGVGTFAAGLGLLQGRKWKWPILRGNVLSRRVYVQPEAAYPA